LEPGAVGDLLPGAEDDAFVVVEETNLGDVDRGSDILWMGTLNHQLDGNYCCIILFYCSFISWWNVVS
jgi:hypothetical protein